MPSSKLKKKIPFNSQVLHMLVEEPLVKCVSYPWVFMLLGQHVAYWSQYLWLCI